MAAESPKKQTQFKAKQTQSLKSQNECKLTMLRAGSAKGMPLGIGKIGFVLALFFLAHIRIFLHNPL